MMKSPKVTSFIISGALLVFLTGCIGAAVTGTTTLGYAVVQERSVGDAIDDTTISAQIQSSYLKQDINDLYHEVDVDVHEGRVLLTGQVKTVEHRIDAVRLAWQPRGVKEVINELQVSDKTTLEDYARDAFITAQVKASLLFDTTIRSINYSVDTVNRVVYLMGIAQDETELRKATHITSTTKGVKKVISHVRLKDDPQRY